MFKTFGPPLAIIAISFVGLVLVLSAILGMVAPAAAEAPTFTPYPSCGDESGPEFGRCVWDARHEGNGVGHSYVNSKSGHVTYVPHWVAHSLRGF